MNKTFRTKSLNEHYEVSKNHDVIKWSLKTILEVRGNFNVRTKNGTIVTVTNKNLSKAISKVWVSNNYA